MNLFLYPLSSTVPHHVNARDCSQKVGAGYGLYVDDQGISCGGPIN